MGVSLVVVISLLAFVINIGMFVKAKINLQNAVDAAAWSGAAVQARQLTNIAYLNWEMRNTYKEWMYKYYVLGQISLPKIQPGNIDNNSITMQPNPARMSFRLNPFWNPTDGSFKANMRDKYNFPSTCIHFKSDLNTKVNNICSTISAVGIPRFGNVDIPGFKESAEAFLTAIAKAKSDDCSKRSILNFATSMTWIYGTGEGQLVPDAPEVATSRIGAWIESMTLALRMRNLEMIVNRPALENLCKNGQNCTSIDQIDNLHENLPFDERPVKAFYSAYRNLSNDGEMKESFKLTELSPQKFVADSKSLSGFLIPENDNKIGNTNSTAYDKTYLDLQIIPLNLSTLFTTFVARGGKFAGQNTSNTEGGCSSSKTAIPVPGYILGFVKNPQILTYYAVKGEVQYTGLFYPFKNQKGITLKAYAAAKPYGGRIGPQLFGIRNNSSIIPRQETTQSWSAPYVTTIDLNNKKNYEPGDLIPLSSDYWAQDDKQPIGGVPGKSGKIFYTVPNLLYEYSKPSDFKGQETPTTGGWLQVATPIEKYEDMDKITESMGLFSTAQFKHFSKGLDLNKLTPTDLVNQIKEVRRPTSYEALNYLIPTYNNKEAKMDTASSVFNLSGDQNKIQYRLYAPIMGPETLFNNVYSIERIVDDHINNNLVAINKYMDALQSVAESIKKYEQNTKGGLDSGDVSRAANTIYDLSDDPRKNGGTITGECKSLAGKFWFYFLGKIQPPQPDACGITPLKIAVQNYLFKLKNDDSYKDYYTQSYHQPEIPQEKSKLATGFVPGLRQGAGENGEKLHPFNQNDSQTRSKRNFYSTKFISIKKLTDPTTDSVSYWKKAVFANYDELSKVPTDMTNNTITSPNILNKSELSEFGELFF